MVTYAMGTVGTNLNKATYAETTTAQFTGSLSNVEALSNQVQFSKNVYNSNGLMAWYRLDTSGVQQTDSSSFGNHALATQALLLKDGHLNGVLGSCHDFFVPGSNGAVVATANNQNNVSGTKLTVAAWVNMTAWPAAGVTRFVTKRDEVNNKDSYSLSVNVNGQVLFAMASGEISANATLGSPAMTTASYFRFVGVFDGDVVTGSNLLLYKNGVLAVTGSVSVTTIGSSTGSLFIGVNPTIPRYYSGLIESVEIYNRAWTAGEVGSDFNNGSGMGLYRTGSYVITKDLGGGAGLTKHVQGFVYTSGGLGPLTADYRLSNDLTTWTNYVNDATGSISLTNNFYRYLQVRFNLSGNGAVV